MKKITLFLVCISAMLLLCFQCEDEHVGDWRVKNLSNQTLILKPTRNASVIQNDTVISGESANFQYLVSLNPERSSFYHWFQHLSIDENSLFEVFSEDDILLKTWSYSDMNLPGKQFFNESSWRYEEKVDDREIYAKWTFDILPEDLIQP